MAYDRWTALSGNPKYAKRVLQRYALERVTKVSQGIMECGESVRENLELGNRWLWLLRIIEGALRSDALAMR